MVVGGVLKYKERTEMNADSEVTSKPSSLPMYCISRDSSSLVSCLA